MEQSNKTKIGLIGAGNICRVGHGPAIKADGRAYIAAISDPDPHNRDTFAKKYRISGVYEDHRAMLEREDQMLLSYLRPHGFTRVMLKTAPKEVFLSCAKNRWRRLLKTVVQ